MSSCFCQSLSTWWPVATLGERVGAFEMRDLFCQQKVYLCTPEQFVRHWMPSRCEEEGCASQPVFNVEGEARGRFCKVHKRTGGLRVRAHRLDSLQPGRVQGLRVTQVGEEAQTTRGAQELAGVGVDRRQDSVHHQRGAPILRWVPGRQRADRTVFVSAVSVLCYGCF